MKPKPQLILSRDVRSRLIEHVRLVGGTTKEPIPPDLQALLEELPTLYEEGQAVDRGEDLELITVAVLIGEAAGVKPQAHCDILARNLGIEQARPLQRRHSRHPSDRESGNEADHGSV